MGKSLRSSRGSFFLSRCGLFSSRSFLLDLSFRCLLTNKGETILLGGVGRVNGRVDITRGLAVDRGSVISRSGMINRGVDNWLGHNHRLVGSGGNIPRLVGGGGNNHRLDNLHHWGRLVGRGRGRHIRLGIRVSSHTLILDISNIALRASSVGDNLDTAVRKVDTVFTIGVIVVPVFLL